MLTKEECLESLNNFWEAQDENHRLYWSRSVLNKLINEHFDKSASFNHFKLHADSTLKTFKKDELIDYIHILYHNWKGSDCAYNNVVKANFQLLDEINELKSNPPLKKDEIKEFFDKPIWDNKLKIWIRIVCRVDGRLRFERFYYDVSDAFEFEEDRFYRKQVQEDD